MSNTTAHQVLVNAAEGFLPVLLEQKGFREQMIRYIIQAGRQEKRRRALTANVVMLFVLLMSLKRSVSIANLLMEFFSVLREKAPDLPFDPVSDEAMILAKGRLGVEPLKLLFEERARSVVPDESFHGLRPSVVDGVHFRLPDTEENEAEFGRPSASRGRTAFPQMTGLPLLDATTRRIRDVVFGSCTMSERDACSELLKHLGPKDLLLNDRGFAAVWLMEECLQRPTHFLTRLPLGWKPIVLRVLGIGDSICLVSKRVPLSPEEQERQGKKTRVVTLEVRIIEYTIGNNQRVRLATDLLDPVEFPAMEFAEYYHNRWEVELAFKEIKVHLATVTHGTQHTTFRSKTPAGILQEAYALFTVYNLIRELMGEAARVHKLNPLHISFVGTVEVVRRALPKFEMTSPDARQTFIERLLDEIASCVNTRPRRARQCPRVIKVKMSKWQVRRPHHRARPHHPKQNIRLTRRYTKKSPKRTSAA